MSAAADSNGDGNGRPPSAGSEAMSARTDARRRAEMIGRMRRIAAGGGAASSAQPKPAAAPVEHCDFCETEIPSSHRHMVDLDERRILCACESCWSQRSDEPSLRPAGVRTLRFPDFRLPDEIWARFEVPVGLAFFMINGQSGELSSMYPSPVGATESPIDPAAWTALIELNPGLEGLEPDSEALIIDRTDGRFRRAVIAPIDECYRLVGMIKVSWEGLSGGDGPANATKAFFESLDSSSAGRTAAA